MFIYMPVTMSSCECFLEFVNVSLELVGNSSELPPLRGGNETHVLSCFRAATTEGEETDVLLMLGHL